MSAGFLAGSFDPFTNGHLAILRDALTIFDEMIVGVGSHPSKSGLLGQTERVALIESCARDLADDRVKVVLFGDLLVDAARREGADALVRGVRDGTDLDYELQMIGMNRAMAPLLPTVLIPPTPETRHVTGTLVRQIWKMGGDIGAFVPAATLAALSQRAR